MNTTDDSLIARATLAHLRHCERTGERFRMPANGSSYVDDFHVVLSNVNGELTAYHYNSDTGRIGHRVFAFKRPKKAGAK